MEITKNNNDDKILESFIITDSVVNFRKIKAYSIQFLLKFKEQCPECPKELEFLDDMYKRGEIKEKYVAKKIDSSIMEKDMTSKMHRIHNQADDITKKIRSIKSDMSKISTENELKISERIMDSMSLEYLDEMTSFIFVKGMWEKIAECRKIYARLCSLFYLKFNSEFTRRLISNIQIEFTRKETGSSEDLDKFCAGRMGIILFVKELTIVKVIPPRISLLCLQELSKFYDGDKLKENNVFWYCKLLGNIFPLIQSPTTKNLFIPAFDVIEKMQVDPNNLPCRLIFSIQDTIDIKNKTI